MEEKAVTEQEAGERGAAERPKGLNFLAKKRVGPKLSADSLNSPRPQGVSRMPYVLKELLTSRRPSNTPVTEYLPSPNTGEEYTDKEDVKVLKMGTLHKTSQSRRPNAEVGPTRQRRFRLTPESLEYFQHFSHMLINKGDILWRFWLERLHVVKIQRNYPLTSLEEIVYPVNNDKQEFQLIFASYLMTLRSDSESDAEEWVHMIRNAWKEWQLPTPAGSSVGSLVIPPTTLHPIAEEEENTSNAGTPQNDRHASHSSDLFSSRQPVTAIPATPLPHTSNTLPQERPRSNTHSGFLRRESTEAEFPTYDKRRQRRIRGLRIRKIAKLAPKLEKQQRHNEVTLSSKLHEDHAMIKYPSSRWSIPAEKVVSLDKDNLVVIWRHNERVLFKRKDSSKNRIKSSLGLHKVLEVRRGQLTEKFDQFPYEEVEHQSFSLIFEQVTKRYVRLTSLDLICDSPEKCEDWILGLRETTNHLSGSLFPSELYSNTDPTILWLKKLWAIAQKEHEISQNDAMDLLTMFRPGTLQARCRQILSDSHHYQFRHTFLRGNALRWEGFVLMYNLLCSNTGRLGSLFKKYAVKDPKLGMTEEELRMFLQKECQWPESSCSDLQALICHHDYHHRAYKKYVAQGVPHDYQIGSTLLSYAGFLSFLRSKDNSPINLDQTTVYQDMNQPLSHYFINSSHNTYLEADQLYGKSSTDAYIRVLLQGCRCIEIDCWNDKLNVKGVGEPVIYHGYTLTTKLPFREVIQTIREYAFTASLYPLIISIENHCSSAQQTKMAKIFQAVMGDVLPKENLCEKESRVRLPSPQELQGKIILKGSFKLSRQAGGGRRTPRHEAQVSTSIPASLHPEESVTSTVATSPSAKDPPSLEPTAVALLQAKQQLPSRRSLHRTKSSTYRARRYQLKESVNDLQRSGQLESTIYQDDDQELVFTETVGDMKSLIVYCRAISLKPWKFEKQAQTPVSNMFSFGEPSALRRCEKYPIQMLACTERQLVRTYPRGTRFDSANYPAMNMWQCGVQMVALNFQYPDVHMHLNQGLFRLNGGCGYVLKPEVMRQLNRDVDFDPRMSTPHPDVTPINLEIELLSGQQLCYWEKKCHGCTVDIHTYGVPHDTETAAMSTAVAQGIDLLWPQWSEGEHVFHKRVLMPEMCLVYLRVEVTTGRPAARKTTLYGQNCIPLVTLLPGVKYIPLRTPGGELIPESGLFLRIKKEEEKEGERRKVSEERGGDARGMARQRRKLVHQYEISREQGENMEVDVTQSIFPSAALRERLAARGEEEEEEEWEVGEGGEVGFSMQRSFTSPPLLESYSRHPLASFDDSKKLSLDEKHKTSKRREEIQITAEIHELEPTTATGHTRSHGGVNAAMFEGAYSSKHQPSSTSGSRDTGKPAQLLTIEPSAPEASDGVDGKGDDDDIVIGGKTFALKYSDDELEFEQWRKCGYGLELGD